MMSQPYIGIFTDGAEQWCRKVGLDAPRFNEIERAYYIALRRGHKLFEKSYNDYMSALMESLNASDAYFYKIRSLREQIWGYYNVGTDLCDNQFCGNTILCMLYMPIDILNIDNVGLWIKNMSVISGKLAAFFCCLDYSPYEYNRNIKVKYKDYHFYRNCPLKEKNKLGFLLFSILCSINYTIEFIDKYFVDEIPQKFKFAYLKYYYLCDFVNS